MVELGACLARAREQSRYSQAQVGAALGVSRAMVSYWESGARKPNDRQFNSLAALYGVEPFDLRAGNVEAPNGPDLAQMLFRSVDSIGDGWQLGAREFVRFLDRYADLAELLSVPIRGMRQSPFVHQGDFTRQDDARRKAEDVRAFLRLGIGPITNILDVCEGLGITVYSSPLGGDLRAVPSGAFLNHPKVGFSILVNLNMTPGRRRFTIAHEIGHALFHSDENACVVSVGTGPRESFADAFAGELLLPSEGVRRIMELTGMPRRIIDPVDVILIQRYFRVSWPAALFRMRQMNAITSDAFTRWRRDIRPVALARSLGYSIGLEEKQQDPELWRIKKFPRPFLRMLRQAVTQDVMSVSASAWFAGLAIPDVLSILGETRPEDEDEPLELATEFREFEDSGVI